MPYKVFVAGEEALAADVNSYLMSQTVPRFTNATQRTSQLTAPVLNQLSMLDSRPGVTQYWNGSAWADTGIFLQGGVTNMSIPAADGNGTITFPVPFGAVPLAITANIQGGGGVPGAYLVSLSTFFVDKVFVRVFLPNGTPAGPGALWVSWLALGVKA